MEWRGPASVCDEPLGGTSPSPHCLYRIGTLDVQSLSSSTRLCLFKLYWKRGKLRATCRIRLGFELDPTSWETNLIHSVQFC